MKKIWLVLVFVAMLLTGCGDSTTHIDNDLDQVSNYDTSKTSVIMDSITSKIYLATTELETQGEILLDILGDSYLEYESNKDTLVTFYEDSLQCSVELYQDVEELSVEYFREILSQDIAEEDTWNEATDDFYFRWEEAIQGYYIAITDIYSKIQMKGHTLLEDVRLEQGVAVYNSIWNNFEMERAEAEIEVFDAYDIFYMDLFTMYSDIQSSFLDKTIDVESVLSREEIVEDEEEDTESTPEWVDGMRYGFKVSVDNYTDFYEQYFAFLDTYDPEGMDQVQFQQYIDLLAQKGGLDHVFSMMDKDAINEYEVKYYEAAKKWVNDKLVEYGE